MPHDKKGKKLEIRKREGDRFCKRKTKKEERKAILRKSASKGRKKLGFVLVIGTRLMMGKCLRRKTMTGGKREATQSPESWVR